MANQQKLDEEIIDIADSDSDNDNNNNNNTKQSVGLDADGDGIMKCQVCEKSTGIRHFGGIACRACGAFFRRCIALNKVYNCQCALKKFINDIVDEQFCSRVFCRACRLKKCLEIGMQPEAVRSAHLRRFHTERLAINEAKLQSPHENRRAQTNLAISLIKSVEQYERFIDGLKPIEQQYKRIWDSSQLLPEAYTNRHQTLSGLLQDKYNLLADAHQFPEEPIGWDKAQLIRDMDMNGLFSLNAMTVHFINQSFLTIEMAKTLPFFSQLDLNDQICQINHVRRSLNFIFNAYHSHAIAAKCVTRKNGIPLTAFLEAKQIQGDQKIRTIFLQSACRLVEKMTESGLEYDEFLLLLLIVFSNSTADGLSPAGREFLYKQSIDHSKALHKLLQVKFGFFGGSQKFAALMNVLNYAIGLKYNFDQMNTYIEVFYTKSVPFLPKCMRQFNK